MKIALVKLRANIMLILAALIWGATFSAQKSAMEFMGPFMFNGTRCLIGAISLFVVSLFIKDRHNQKRKPLIEGGLVAGCLLFMGTTLQQAGIVNTTAGKAGFISSLYIVMVAIFSFFSGKKIRKSVWLSTFLATVGLYLLSSPSATFEINKGDLTVLFSAIFFAIHIICISKYSKKTNPIKLSALQFLTAGTLAVALGLLYETTPLSAFQNCIFELFCAGVLSCAIAFTLQISAQKHIRADVASLILSLESIFAVIFGCLILNETLNLKELSGCILMLIAVISVIGTKKK